MLTPQQWLSIGLLRQALHLAALLSGLLLPFGGAPDYTATWDLLFNGVLPAMVPIFLILIGFGFECLGLWSSCLCRYARSC